MRAIDADALLDDIMERYCRDCDRRKGIKRGKWRVVYEIGDVPCRACGRDDIMDAIENAPTICLNHSDEEVTEFCVQGPCTEMLKGKCLSRRSEE